MLSSLRDIPTLKRADFDSSDTARGLLRITRRIAKRCWLDQGTINQPRVFCQNSGGCGSTYIVELLTLNGIERSFHEKTPDLLEVGLEHYEHPLPDARLIRLLRYTRHDIYFEANNRLFSLSRQIAGAFPGCVFIHLHRNAADSVRSSMSKQRLKDDFNTNIRYRGSLAGPHEDDLFTRVCHHWANMNRRIHDDLAFLETKHRTVVSLRFEDLIAGNVDPLEDVLGRELELKKCPPVNVRPTGSSGRFPACVDWTPRQRQTFDEICGPVMELLQQQ